MFIIDDGKVAIQLHDLEQVVHDRLDIEKYDFALRVSMPPLESTRMATPELDR